METVLNILHVVAAVFLIGPMAILPMTAMGMLRRGRNSDVAALAKSTNVFSLLSLLVVVFGFGVLGMSDPKYHLSITTGWVLISIVAYVVALALNLFIVVPAMRKAAAGVDVTSGAGAASAGGTALGAGEPAGARAGYPQIAASSGLVTLLLVLVVVLMVWKP
ncbi:DUF2269 family protein [Paenarthrobacter sp. PH39-S1]|uniref:DUF2269 family protein n=1 Tax=Paenarthrobacter sp. PH39-S1 TaxID=3046204 RepID=UPI0024BACBA9|nr:DUF2269 family protein [Paenarthrobacter sp. PH39-S1]MDJ0355112.1 DUF2269 family protein [Paenarthrobacter sp. PH39-S1]